MKPSSRHGVATALAAVAGLCLAVVLALLTSNLSAQRIGLAGESPTVGRSLVAKPRSAKTDPAHPAVRKRRKTKTETEAAANPTGTPPAVTPSAAGGGTSSNGSGSNSSGNDDARVDRETAETHTTEDTGETHTTETHTEPDDHPESEPDDDD